jgi:hypothetical protein
MNPTTSATLFKVLAIFEKNQVIHSIEEWQVARTARNLAAHDYEINYDDVADHFNTLHALTNSLYHTARRFIGYCEKELGIRPSSPDFSEEFYLIIG